jgi:ferredoxin
VIARVNPIRCKAKRVCSEICPEVFQLDVWGYAYVVDGRAEVPAELEAKAREAAAACPEDAIVLRDD